jgi:hypothetical protein
VKFPRRLLETADRGVALSVEEHAIDGHASQEAQDDPVQGERHSGHRYSPSKWPATRAGC